jgi:hypothetical protein
MGKKLQQLESEFNSKDRQQIDSECYKQYNHILGMHNKIHPNREAESWSVKRSTLSKCCAKVPEGLEQTLKT